MEKQPKTDSSGPSGRRKLALGMGALLAVFLLGYVPSCRTARNAETQSAQLERKLKLVELHSQLGMMSYEANRNNYAVAAQFSTEFFNRLKQEINQATDAALKQKLEEFGSRRDEITAHLALADPTVKEKIGAMYADFYPVITTP